MSYRRLNGMASVIAVLCFTAGAERTQADLVAYWDFNATPHAVSITATTGSGTFDRSGFGGTVTNFGGTTVNALGSGAGADIALQNGGGGAGNNTYVQIQCSMTGFSDLVITYATRRSSTGFNSQQWLYSTDGSTFTPAGAAVSPNLDSHQLRTVDLTGVSDLSDAATVYLRCVFTGGSASSATGNNRIDNIQLNASVFVVGGACCNGDSCTIQPQAVCESGDGTYHGDGSTCSPSPCTAEPTGACCDPTNGVCSVTTTAGCGGDFQGVGSSCSPSPCPPPPTGGCCISGVCSVNTPIGCTNAGGTYLGDGFQCGAFACPCISATEARAVADGVGVAVCNVTVTSITDLISSTTTKTIHVQDTSGTLGVRGITVFGSNNAIDTLDFFVNVGDTLTLYGETDSFNGLFELSDTNNNHLATLNILPGEPLPPRDTTLAELQPATSTAEQLESVLIRTECVTFVESGTFAGLTNYTAQAGAGAIVVRVATGDLDLVNQPIPTGPVRITGIFSQFDSSAPFDDGYQLLPRSIADIEPCSTSGCATCPGDFDGSAARDGRDIQQFVNCFLASAGGAPTSGCECVDMNNDQTVSDIDINDVNVGIVAVLLNSAPCP